MSATGQVEALPRIEVNVCFRALIPEGGLTDFGPVRSVERPVLHFKPEARIAAVGGHSSYINNMDQQAH